MSTVAENFSLELPEGWCLVDFRSLLDEQLLDQVTEALVSALPTSDGDIAVRSLSFLRDDAAAAGVLLFALRSPVGEHALELLTVAAPDASLRSGSDTTTTPTSQPNVGPGHEEVMTLAEGAEAVIHADEPTGGKPGDGRWTTVQVLIAVPGNGSPLLVTLMSSQADSRESLAEEARRIAQSFSGPETQD
jgi:hypothetical protein